MTREGAECETSIYDDDPEIAELLLNAKKILKSRTEQAERLTINIRSSNIRSSHRRLVKDMDIMAALDEIKSRIVALEKVAHQPRKMSREIRKGDDESQRGEILKKRTV
jgi:hypothetical protein